MSTVILRGEEAIHYAEVHHMMLHRYDDSLGMTPEEVSLDEAQKLPEAELGHICLEIHVGINSGDAEH